MQSSHFVCAVLGAMMLGHGVTASAQEPVPEASTSDSLAPAANGNVTTGHSVATGQQWRYRWHNGRWWYWLPSQRWVYWSRDHWEDYLPPPPTPDSPAQAAVTVSRDPATYYRYRASSYYGAWGYSTYGRGRYYRLQRYD